MARRRCAKDAPDLGGKLDRSKLPPAPEGHTWSEGLGTRYNAAEEDWYYLHTDGETDIWVTGPNLPTDTRVRAGYMRTDGFWFPSAEVAIVELFMLRRLGVEKE